MKIAEVSTYVLKLRTDQVYLGSQADDSPLGETGYQVRHPWRSLYSARFETLLVRITADDGTTGWGEALAPVGPEIPAAIVERLLAPVLIGRAFDGPRPAWSLLRDLMRERGHLVGHQADALAAIDIALWDLHGRLIGRNVANLLGGAFRRHVPAYVSGLPYPTDAERAQAATRWADAGATRIKLHLGYGVDADLATVDAVQAAAPDVAVGVDAHWAYGLPAASRLGLALADRGVLFLEAPLAPEDVSGHAELAARLSIPVAVGETLRNRYEFDAWLSARALGLAQPDVARTGITEAMIISELAAARHVPIACHHSAGLGVAMAAGLHVSAAAQDAPFFEFQPTTFPVAQSILRTPLVGGPDGFALPDGPGLGVDVDVEKVVAHAVAGAVITDTGHTPLTMHSKEI